jgi:predicted Rdx family selenoprotein
LAAEIRQALGIEPELVKGANGIFDVSADGKLVFSRHRDARFPGADEIIRSLRSLA